MYTVDIFRKHHLLATDCVARMQHPLFVMLVGLTEQIHSIRTVAMGLFVDIFCKT
jgi:hypothetical protein